jgi:hypothetical protein
MTGEIRNINSSHFRYTENPFILQQSGANNFRLPRFVKDLPKHTHLPFSSRLAALAWPQASCRVRFLFFPFFYLLASKIHDTEQHPPQSLSSSGIEQPRQLTCHSLNHPVTQSYPLPSPLSHVPISILAHLDVSVSLAIYSLIM